jgi:nucleoid DNA-binding protein
MATTKTTTATKAKSKITAVKTVEDTEIDVEASVDKEAKPVDPNMIKKKDIYDHVSVSTGLRKRDVREAVDSLLEYMHKCLEDGKTIQVPPLGKIKSVERGSGDNVKTHYKLTLKKTVDAEKKAG